MSLFFPFNFFILQLVMVSSLFSSFLPFQSLLYPLKIPLIPPINHGIVPFLPFPPLLIPFIPLKIPLNSQL